jgi:hypothetical protein
MIVDQESIVVCVTSIIFGALLFLGSWISLYDADGGYAKVLGVFLFCGLFMFFLGAFTLLFGDVWMEIGRWEKWDRF